MARFIQVMTAIDDAVTARKIADRLVGKKLAACVQISGPVTSVYRWKGKIEKTKEWRLIVKTRRALYGKVEKAIREDHPYDVPEIMAVPVLAGGKDYLGWIVDCTKT